MVMTQIRQVSALRESRLVSRLLVVVSFSLGFLVILGLLLPDASLAFKLQLTAYVFGIATVLVEGGYALWALSAKPRD